MTIAEIFDATFERPTTLAEWGRFSIRWLIISAVLTLTGVLAVAIAMAFVKDAASLTQVISYIRAGLILILCCFMVYATYMNAVNKNRKKREEELAMYKEIAVYYREKNAEVGTEGR